VSGPGKDLASSAAALSSELVNWRRRLHRMPELGFEVHRTAAFVVERLEQLGIEVRTGLAETGVVGILRAENPAGPAVLLRADMDALPIQEVAGREYGSEVDGCMHACGHDGHTAMLLGAATLLSERRAELGRDVLLCFQPAEEGGGGGKRMIDEGLLSIVETGSVYGLHLWSGFPAGTVHVRPGAAMAAQDEFLARIIGRGGHAAMPQHTIDPIVAAASAVGALQSIVSRNVDPLRAGVVSVGRFQAGSACNIIPDEVEIEGTLRAFCPETREILRKRVGEVLRGCAEAHGCTVELDLQYGYPAVVNDGRAVEIVREIAGSMLGADRVSEAEPMACAEDFAYFLEERPGAFVFLGSRNEARGIDAPHHTPRFDIDEEALPVGAELLARLALHDVHPG
jgi:amidohydrolase